MDRQGVQKRRSVRVLLWPLFSRSAWAKPATVVTGTAGEGAALASVRRLVIGGHTRLVIFSKTCRLVVGGHTCLGICSKTCRLVVGGHTCIGIFSKSCRFVVGGHTVGTGAALRVVFTAALTEMISAFPET
jgi:hypothetical protein